MASQLKRLSEELSSKQILKYGVMESLENPQSDSDLKGLADETDPEFERLFSGSLSFDEENLKLYKNIDFLPPEGNNCQMSINH